MNCRQINTIDCAIIGAGPAGIAAAIQCTRQGLANVVFEGDRLGGQVHAANLIENLPGFPEGIRGPELVQQFKRQIDSYGITMRCERVEKITREHNRFSVLSARDEMMAKTVIVATGLVPKRLGIPGEAKLWGKRIFSYINPRDVACTGTTVLVIGSGDAAFDQALNFARAGRDVTVAMKHAKPRCLPLLSDRAHVAGITVVGTFEAMSIEKVSHGICIHGKEKRSLEADFVVTCIGKESTMQILDPSLLHGKVPGLFYAGDCHRGKNRHIAIACGDGIACAMDAARFIYHEYHETT